MVSLSPKYIEQCKNRQKKTDRSLQPFTPHLLLSHLLLLVAGLLRRGGGGGLLGGLGLGLLLDLLGDLLDLLRGLDGLGLGRLIDLLLNNLELLNLLRHLSSSLGLLLLTLNLLVILLDNRLLESPGIKTSPAHGIALGALHVLLILTIVEAAEIVLGFVLGDGRLVDDLLGLLGGLGVQGLVGLVDTVGADGVGRGGAELLEFGDKETVDCLFAKWFSVVY